MSQVRADSPVFEKKEPPIDKAGVMLDVIRSESGFHLSQHDELKQTKTHLGERCVFVYQDTDREFTRLTDKEVRKYQEFLASYTEGVGDEKGYQEVLWSNVWIPLALLDLSLSEVPNHTQEEILFGRKA